MGGDVPVREGQVLTGPLFSEPMRVETVRASGADAWVAGLVCPYPITSPDISPKSVKYPG